MWRTDRCCGGPISPAADRSCCGGLISAVADFGGLGGPPCELADSGLRNLADWRTSADCCGGLLADSWRTTGGLSVDCGGVEIVSPPHARGTVSSVQFSQFPCNLTIPREANESTSQLPVHLPFVADYLADFCRTSPGPLPDFWRTRGFLADRPGSGGLWRRGGLLADFGGLLADWLAESSRLANFAGLCAGCSDVAVRWPTVHVGLAASSSSSDGPCSRGERADQFAECVLQGLVAPRLLDQLVGPVQVHPEKGGGEVLAHADAVLEAAVLLEVRPELEGRLRRHRELGDRRQRRDDEQGLRPCAAPPPYCRIPSRHERPRPFHDSARGPP
eukprot:gene12007-biopygen8122